MGIDTLTAVNLNDLLNIVSKMTSARFKKYGGV
jgi:hypothetical protein